MRIFIPTLKRGPGRQLTHRELGPLNDTYRTTIVCPPDEVNEFYKAGFHVVGCKAKGIAATRQWILDNTDDPIVLMLDDDLYSWSNRVERANGDVTFLRASERERRAGFREFEKLMRKYAFGSIGHKLFSQDKGRVELNGRMLRALAYNAEVLAKERIRFRVPVMEDFDVQLQLMKRGYDGASFYGIVQEQKGSNVDGGCSTYRTHEVQAAAAHKLAELHPDCVTVVNKTLSKGWAGDMGAERVDVRISWRKAVKVGKEYRNARR